MPERTFPFTVIGKKNYMILETTASCYIMRLQPRHENRFIPAFLHFEEKTMGGFPSYPGLVLMPLVTMGGSGDRKTSHSAPPWVEG